ncbi:MAG: beta-ketoacyl-ACP synthase II [Candidatus Aureabacteria bacterium]|nr:beta-ketoacyl-ACP synthase II [Candidatus Auribacterota bacterium]
MRRVVITGVGALAPNGNSAQEMWESLCKGRSGIARISSFDPSLFPTQIGGEVKGFDPKVWINPKEARRMDRFVQFAVVVAKMAVDNAGLDLRKEDLLRIGVVVGSGIGGISTIEEQHTLMVTKGPQRISPFFIPMLIVNMAPGMIAMQLGVKGPNCCIVSACASAAHSIGEASLMIKFGDADVMIAGGTEAAVTPLSIAGFCALKALSTRNDAPEKASRPFDKERDGFVMSEGAGVVILEELEHARKRDARIYAELIGYGSTADAYHMTAPAPGGEGAAACMRMAVKNAGVNPDGIDYINAHGTSTNLNDKYETMAIKDVFRDHAKKLAVSSNKSMFGHLLGAAGGVELISTVFTLTHGIIPPTINYEYPDPECDLDYVPNTAREQSVRVAMSNSFGFGGHNSSLVVRKFEG